MNPCPCGYYGDVFRQCTCTPGTVQKYQKCISGPVLARIDLHIQVPRLREEELLQPRTGEASAAIRVRVCRAREVQARRFASAPPAQPSSSVRLHPADQLAARADKPRGKDVWSLFCNVQISRRELHAYCAPSESVQALLRAAIGQLRPSARAYDRLLKASRTNADLEGTENIQNAHAAKAIQYRSLDRKLCGT